VKGCMHRNEMHMHMCRSIINGTVKDDIA